MILLRKQRRLSLMKKTLLIIALQVVMLISMEDLALTRPLNPSQQDCLSKLILDKYFCAAFDAATRGDFDAAISNYRKAFLTAPSKCDREHAKAGLIAAEGAKAVQQRLGYRGKPSQGFWQQLQKRTASLRTLTNCVHVK
jgi:hypothetical protein